MQRKLDGIGVALVTPFDNDGQISYPNFSKLLDHVSPIVDYLVVNGTTGESPTTTAAEKQAILSFVVGHNPRQLPIVYGIGGNNTDSVVKNIQKADLSGVDAVLSVVPYYNKPPQAGLKAHYTKIADASPVPILLYNVPGRTVIDMAVETIVDLAEHPNIIGVKEASIDIKKVERLAQVLPKDFFLISGCDDFTMEYQQLGAAGVISVLANAIPQTFKEIVQYAQKGQWDLARQAQAPIMSLDECMYQEGNPSGVKYLMEYMDICQSTVRLPLVRISGKLQKDIQNAYNKHF